MGAKSKWLAGDVPAARSILALAFQVGEVGCAVRALVLAPPQVSSHPPMVLTLGGRERSQCIGLRLLCRQLGPHKDLRAGKMAQL